MMIQSFDEEIQAGAQAPSAGDVAALQLKVQE